ncbi:MAG: outer membrane protein assembly factor BamA [Sphingomonas sp.]|uniref:outer membrane protein assembly factor BamA n=1 Tax=Sphingomonas sp. TaxID=28214 RepID=UPI0025D1C349|nr:outer membrane protein assembly factor BamA [Sphingomonas sp.]MBX9882776.1 outer membrane protein assembly factor BamA [Sphingomonas sp.]
MVTVTESHGAARLAVGLLAGTILGGLPVLAHAQEAAPAPQASTAPASAPQPGTPPAAPATPAPEQSRVIKSIRVEGSQRIEPETVLSYTKLRIGDNFTNETLDRAIKDLQASDLFADVQIEGALTGDIVVRIRENPIINRVIFEGNRRLKQDKIDKEIKLKPRQIFTRTAVRQDVQRIIELYRRQGRFAASVSPKMVSLDQNRVDVIFEVNEGPKSQVRQINIIGNNVFSDAKLRAQMATKQARLLTLLSSNTGYDQDRLAYDQQKLRQFYLTEGYADFKVISAVAELTPDKRDFIITYVVEEGKRYKFGDVTVDSDIRDFDNKRLAASLPARKGDWYNAKKVEDSIEQINNTAGLYGYAFSDVNPQYRPDRDALTLSIEFHIEQQQRTYVERIDVNGNTLTQDKVIRREIRLNEGDAFNRFLVKRSQDRINSLGFFQDKLEIKEKPGTAPDRVILETNVEERSTGELNLSVGFSSLEQFVVQAAVRQRNFRGKGQELRLSGSYSQFARSVEAGFTEPYLFDRNIGLGFDIYRRDYNNFNFLNSNRNNTYSQVSTGFSVRVGVPLTEYWSLSGRYTLQQDQIGLGANFFDQNGQCDVLTAGRFLCEQLGTRVTSAIGFTLLYDSLNSRLRPTAGRRLSINADLAGLGGDVRYARLATNFSQFKSIGAGFILSFQAEGGYIVPLQGGPAPGVDPIRINDRFYLGEPNFRGFQIRGVGPRVLRAAFIDDPVTGAQIVDPNRRNYQDDAIGGRTYYHGRIELELPLGSGARELGLRPSIYTDIGALFGVRRPLPTANFVRGANPITGRDEVLPFCQLGTLGVTGRDPALPGSGLLACLDGTGTVVAQPIAAFSEQFVGDTPLPRISVGIGVNWNSPFGPLRIDVARAIVSRFGDDTKLITFNVGTQF